MLTILAGDIIGYKFTGDIHGDINGDIWHIQCKISLNLWMFSNPNILFKGH